MEHLRPGQFIAVATSDDLAACLDDTDESELHQRALGYPPKVVTLAAESAERVLAAVRTGAPSCDDPAPLRLAMLVSPQESEASR